MYRNMKVGSDINTCSGPAAYWFSRQFIDLMIFNSVCLTTNKLFGFLGVLQIALNDFGVVTKALLAHNSSK